MASAKKCDRCGEYYEPYNAKNDKEKINGFITANIDDERKYYSQDIFDLCPICCEHFKKWLENKDADVVILKHGVMGNDCEIL